jgi:hypothetical protein
MVRLGKAAVPQDLMTYADSDRQPSIFFLKESPRQSILAVFNWTEHATQHVIPLASLGLPAGGAYRTSDVLRPQRPSPFSAGALHVDLAAHSVRVLKIVDGHQPAVLPVLAIQCAESAVSGQSVACTAAARGAQPVLAYRWSFGDGTSVNGSSAMHTWTEPGSYHIQLEATTLDGSHATQQADIRISGHLPSTFTPAKIRRLGQ